MTRRRVRLLAVVTAAAVAVAGLSGCSSQAKKAKTGTKYEVVHVTVGDNKVPCVVTNRGGVTCRWGDPTQP